MASNVSYISTHDPKAKVTLLEYTSGDPIYKGTNEAYDAATTDATWTITKFTWSGSDVTKMQILVGAWDSRTTLGWT